MRDRFQGDQNAVFPGDGFVKGIHGRMVDPGQSPNCFRKNRRAGGGHQDLDDELVGGDEDDHLVSVPARHLVDVVVDDPEEGELQDEPGELDSDPDKETGPEHELAGGGVANLEKPEAQEFHPVNLRPPCSGGDRLAR